MKEHVFTLPDQPDLIPYRTSYYAERWGFCMAHNQLAALPDGVYEVLIDASLEDGSLTYGEYLHRGETDDEVLFSAHICHPSLANDNCSGLALLTHLAARLAPLKTRYSYRFVFAPGTIGAIAWLARNEHRVARIRHGLVLSCVGDAGGPTYKKSRRGDAVIDRAMAHVLQHAAPSPTILDFFPYGYDERQYCSPGFRSAGRPVPAQSVRHFPRISYLRRQSRLHPAGAPRLVVSDDRRPARGARARLVAAEARRPNARPSSAGAVSMARSGGDREAAAKSMAFLWILNLADGRHSLLDIAERAKLPFGVVADAARLLKESGLLVEDGCDAQPMSPLRKSCLLLR